MRWFVNHFVPDASRLTEPDVSPLFADLMEPAARALNGGRDDPLLDHTPSWPFPRSMERAQSAVYLGGLHGLNAFPTPLGKQATEHMDTWLERTLGAVPA